jgi:hypothetical protein
MRARGSELGQAHDCDACVALIAPGGPIHEQRPPAAVEDTADASQGRMKKSAALQLLRTCASCDPSAPTAPCTIKRWSSSSSLHPICSTIARRAVAMQAGDRAPC